MRIEVLMFAAHREISGTGRLTLAVPAGTDLERLYEDIASQVPRMADLRPFTTFAVNREVVPASTVLEDGDEVALLQPVSGGCGD